MSTDPDQIRREIELTQGRLSTDVDALTEKVTPGRIVERRVGRARAAAGRWKDSVMGSDAPSYPGSPAHATRDAVSDRASAAAGAVSDAGSSAADAVQQAPQAVRRQTQGSPLAAGVIAFGAGWLISALLPASQREQQLAEQAKDRAGELARPVADAAKQAATEVRDHLQEPAQQAVQQVRETAQDAGRTVADEGRSAAGQVQDRAQQAPDNVRSTH